MKRFIAFVDKTVVKITGLSMKGVKPFELEQILQERLKRAVRVIGVSGTDLKLDVYGLAPEEILADENGHYKCPFSVKRRVRHGRGADRRGLSAHARFRLKSLKIRLTTAARAKGI